MSDTTHGAGFATLAIHAGAQPDLAAVVLAPLSQTPDYGLGGALPASFGGLPPDLGNAASAVLEERVAALEGGTAAVATGSGAAARMLAFHTLLQHGDEIVAARRAGSPPYEPPLEIAFRNRGWHVRWADADKPESFVEALSDRTKAILVESIADAGAGVTDIEAVATIARRARIPLVVDNTLATPYLVRPLEHGADIVLHTSVGVLGGHACARGGLIVDGGSFSFADDARFPALSQPSPTYGELVVAEAYGNFAFAAGARLLGLREFGGAPSPLEAFLVATGIETLALRLQRQCDTALAVGHHLARHPRVAWVRYAGLERDAGHAIAQRYCPRGAGAVLGFGLRDAGAAALAHRLRLFSTAAEVGGARSLVDRPGPSDSMRVSIGLEDIADIIADLDQALAG